MASTMKDLNGLIDVNTVVGNPFKSEDGTVVIPVSKVTMGFMTGGGEYGEIKPIKSDKSLPFAGGSGAIISLKPSSFLIDKGKGIELVNVADDPLSKMIDVIDKFIKSFKNEDN